VEPQPIERRHQDIDRQEVHRIHQHHPDEHGERGRGDKAVAIAVMKYALHLVVDELDEQLDEGLAFVGNAGGRSAHHPPEKSETHHAEHDGGEYRVHVDGPEAAALAHGLLQKRQVVLYVLGRS
jgi:hypothetical protein